MRRVVTLVTLFLLLSPCAAAQKTKSKKPATRPRTAAGRSTDPAPAARLMGSPVVVVTKNGDQVKGTLLDLSAYSVRIKSGTLESTISLDGVSSLSFGNSPPVPVRTEQPATPAPADFVRDAETALAAFHSMSNATKAGTDYSDYGRLLTDLRAAAERFVQKYSSSDNATAARILALLSGALTDYTWARTIWTLKLGRSSDGMVSEADSQIITDTLAIYPDLRPAGSSASRIPGDKLTAGLWRKASDKIDRANSLVGKSH